MRLRFLFSIIKGLLPQGLFYIPKAEWILHHPKKYNDEDLYKHALKIVRLEKILAKTSTNVYGLENLPKSGGYIMYSNHQGKYDALGILCAHKHKPMSVLWDYSSSHHILASQVHRLLKCQIINLKKPATFMPSIRAVCEAVKNGKPYLIFPEGGYKDNKNTLQEFQTGCFMASVQSKSPIVPVTIYDSWKSMDRNELLLHITTQVHFLSQIPYEEYKAMNRKEISSLVKERIQQRLDEIESGKIGKAEMRV